MMQEKLRLDTELLRKQQRWLQISYDECQAIGIRHDYSVDQFGRFETLCSRYSRSIDFLIRRMFRTIDAYEFENQGTLIDVVNHAHKRGLVPDIEQLRLMKDLRNTIVHEYVEEALHQLFSELLDYTPALLAMMAQTQRYLRSIITAD